MRVRPNYIATLTFALLLALPAILLGQVSFTASVNSNKVAVGDRFTVEFSVNERGQNFKAPNFNGFKVLGGPNTSMSTYMDNSGTRFKMGYGYTLQARSKGTFTIGPAFIKHQGKTYRTQPLQITVTEKKAPAKNSPEAKARENVYFKPLLTKRIIYQGQPIYARYKIFFKNEIGNPQITQEPDFNGFYKEDITQERINTKSEVINGQRFTTGDIRKMVLIPQKSGKITLGNINMSVPTSLPTGRYDFFGRPIGRRVNLELTERFPTIEVKPLPLTGQPQDFSGAVGDYTFKASLSQNEITTDESVTLSLELKGTGNIKLASMPALEFPAAFEVFDPEIKESSSVGSYGMRGQKRVEYLLVPRYSGTYKIGPVSFSYFNPSTGRYQTITSPQFEVTVTGGQAPPPGLGQGGISATEKEAVKFIGKDILFIKTKANPWYKINAQFLGSGLFYGLLALIFSLILVLLVYTRITMKNGQNIRLKRQQQAGKVARKHLATAQKALKSNNNETFYEALAAALWGYFAQKLNINASQLSKENISEKLSAAGLGAEPIQKAISLLNSAEMARYTAAGGQNPQQDYEQTAQLITQIERQL